MCRFLGYPIDTYSILKLVSLLHIMTEILSSVPLKRWMEKLHNEGTLDLDYKSCEMMSDDSTIPTQKNI